eukprot:GGOE01036307.1.p1 GENE.GGOE01036307.1~~GGOE01036307.1.p1  ORF type:complete len:221 (+),score=66.92 GGOE01036307.1:40-663(+)
MAPDYEELFGAEEADVLLSGPPPPAPAIPGLLVVRGFLEMEEQVHLLAEVDRMGLLSGKQNQAMSYGGIPTAFEALAVRVAHFVPSRNPSVPRFDQSIINVYAPGQGIRLHKDLPQFDEGIVGLSLGGSTVMDFVADDGRAEAVLLNGGDLYALFGSAQYEWSHGIAARAYDELNGRRFPRLLRVSITLRRALPEFLHKTEIASTIG